MLLIYRRTSVRVEYSFMQIVTAVFGLLFSIIKYVSDVV